MVGYLQNKMGNKRLRRSLSSQILTRVNLSLSFYVLNIRGCGYEPFNLENKMKRSAISVSFVSLLLISVQFISAGPVTKKFYRVNAIVYQEAKVDGKQYLAKKTNPYSPEIDGRLDESVWEEAQWEKGFIQSSPYEGQAPSQQTAFKILYEGKNIYIAVRAYDTEPDKIERRLARRDTLEGDRIEVYIIKRICGNVRKTV